MKKSLLLCLVALSFTVTTNTGCVPNASSTISLPDLGNFSIQAVATFVKGASTLITLASSTLGSGTFNVNFNLSGANSFANQVATLTMNGSTGTFSTPVLNGSGSTTIAINSISNSSGSTNIGSNNTTTFNDSTGLMTATTSGVGGGPTSYRATFLTATFAGGSGGTLAIYGTVWTPWLATISLYIDNYTLALGPVYFNSNVISGTYSAFNGSASYGVSGQGITTPIADLSQHGVVNITSTSPLLTGTFSFTNTDSSMLSSGTFSLPMP